MEAFNRWSPAVLILLILAAMAYRYFYPLAP